MKQAHASKTEEATSLIILDIETFSGIKPNIEDIIPDARLKDPVKIQADKEAKMDKQWRGQSLSSIKGEVYCIGVAVDEEPSEVIIGVDEQETMEMFDIWLGNYTYPKFVAHNGYDFDYLFLYHRGLKHRMKNIVNAFGDKSRLIDTMLLLNGTSWKTMVSLDNMAKLLLGRSAKGDISGADVHDLVLAGEAEKIIRYCAEDVKVLRECYKVLNSMGIY